MESIKFSMIAVFAVMAMSLYETHATEDVSDLPYCTKPTNLSVADEIPNETYVVLNDAMRALNDFCTSSDHNLECPTSGENICTVNSTSAKKERNNQVNRNLEALLGQLHLAGEMCNDEVDKLYRGEESLTEVCSALECEITPAAQAVAKYLLFEKCGCEGEECSYTPGQFTVPVNVSDVAQLFSTIYDTIHSLRKIFCCISTVAPLDSTPAICNDPSSHDGDGESEEDPTVPFGGPPTPPQWDGTF